MIDTFIAAVDFGSSKTALCVARIDAGKATILHYDSMPSVGIFNSAISNTKRTIDVIQPMIQKAEQSLGIKIECIVAGYPKYEVKCEENTGTIERPDPLVPIVKEDIDNIKYEAINAYPLEDPNTYTVIGAVAQNFSIDMNMGMKEKDVEGMDGSRIDADFQIFIGRRAESVRITSVLASCGVANVEKVFTPTAIASEVVSLSDLRKGVAIVDLGAGATSISIFDEGVMRYYASIPYGGANITHDIATELGVEEGLAEEIKIAFGGCKPDRMGDLADKTLRIDADGPVRDVSVKYLSEVICSRFQEIVEAVCWHIEKSGLSDSLSAGVVVCGGGANLRDCCTFFKEYSGYEIRKGYRILSSKITSGQCEGFEGIASNNLWGLVSIALGEGYTFTGSMSSPEATQTSQRVPVVPQEATSEAEAEPSTNDTLFDTSAFETQAQQKPKVKEKEKKPKKERKFMVKWGSKIKNVTDTASGLLDKLQGGLESDNPTLF